MIILKPNDVSTFNKLAIRSRAQSAVMTEFLAQFQIMQEALAEDSNLFWKAIKERYHLEGDYRYENGMLIEVPPAMPPGVPQLRPENPQPWPNNGDEVEALKQRYPATSRQAQPHDFVDPPATAQAEGNTSDIDDERRKVREAHERAHPPQPRRPAPASIAGNPQDIEPTAQELGAASRTLPSSY